jgi:hypothetical protein
MDPGQTMGRFARLFCARSCLNVTEGLGDLSASCKGPACCCCFLLARCSDYESGGREFESLRARQDHKQYQNDMTWRA